MAERLGDYQFKHSHLDFFEGVEAFGNYMELDRFFREIVVKIQKCKEPAFLLPALLHCFSKLSLIDPMTHFEFWLNQFSGLSVEEQLKVRGKIVGKSIPREAYQAFFPIGMNKFYPGTHFVAAHLSPDIDTTVASFIGWLDAFGAKVSLGQHIWSLPGGINDTSFTELFEKIWGKSPFSSIARNSPILTLNAIDLLTRENVELVDTTTSMTQVDPELHKKAILLMSEEGHFLGSWQPRDTNVVRSVLFHFKVLLRQFESSFYTRILRFFADPEAKREKLFQIYLESFQEKLGGSDLTEDEKERLDLFLKEIMGMKNGLEGSFEDLIKKDAPELNALFDADGKLHEDRPLIFKAIEELTTHLKNRILETDNFVELLSTALKLKKKLNTQAQPTLSLSSTIDEMRTKMESQDYLVVLMGEYPVGIIPRHVLSKTFLGTVSLRDFSNFEEVHMAPYLNVISVIDHHKSAFQTMTPSLIIASDVQSCNTLVAEELFQINEKHSYKIHPDRIIAEYFSCLFAICDDTDFLSKVSTRDVVCVAKLLNELKKMIQNEGPYIELEGLSAKQILENSDMHSIYEKIIFLRTEKTKEALFSMNLESLLSDTKEQNGCARIGQTKLFPENFPLFLEKKEHFQKEWEQRAALAYKAHGDIALHLQMISTIPSSNQLSTGIIENDGHLDELWFWIPKDSEYAGNLLATFLNGLLDSPEMHKKAVKVEFNNDESGKLQRLFQQNFLSLPFEVRKSEGGTCTVLYIKAGTLNSRKSMVSPYLPRKV